MEDLQPEKPSQPSFSGADGIALLRKYLRKGERLLQFRPVDEGRYSEWMQVTVECLEVVFGPGSDSVSNFSFAGEVRPRYDVGTPEFENQRAIRLRTQLVLLNGEILRLESV